jgi:hypothetical protein
VTTPDISPEREAEFRAWLVNFNTDPRNAGATSWTRDLLGMVDQARADANYFDNLTKMRLQSLIQDEPEGVNASSDVFDRVIGCFRRLRQERDVATAALAEAKVENDESVTALAETEDDLNEYKALLGRQVADSDDDAHLLEVSFDTLAGVQAELVEAVQCLADACPLGWVAAQDMDEAQAWEKRAAALIVKHGEGEK